MSVILSRHIKGGLIKNAEFKFKGIATKFLSFLIRPRPKSPT